MILISAAQCKREESPVQVRPMIRHERALVLPYCEVGRRVGPMAASGPKAHLAQRP